jgi:DNA-directed RNA polymerase specialized sigma24 family protein
VVDIHRRRPPTPIQPQAISEESTRATSDEFALENRQSSPCSPPVLQMYPHADEPDDGADWILLTHQVRRVVRRLVAPDDVEDIVQGSVLLVLRRIARGKPVPTLEALLRRVARGLAVDRLRQLDRLRQQLQSAPERTNPHCYNADISSSIDDEAQLQQHLRNVLSGRQFAVANLVMFTNLSKTTIGHTLGMSTSEVGKVALQVWKKLQKHPPQDGLETQQ